MKAPKINHTVPLENPSSAQLSAAFAGLKPGFASCAGLKKTHSQSTVTRVTAMRPMAAPGMGSSIRPTITPAKIAGELNADTRTTASLALARFYTGYTLMMPDTALAPDEANVIGALEWAHAHDEGEVVADLCAGMGDYWSERGKTAAGLA